MCHKSHTTLTQATFRKFNMRYQLTDCAVVKLNKEPRCRMEVHHLSSPSLTLAHLSQLLAARERITRPSAVNLCPLAIQGRWPLWRVILSEQKWPLL